MTGMLNLLQRLKKLVSRAPAPEPPRARGRPRKYDHALILRLAKNGMAVPQISEQTGIPQRTIYTVCRYHGVHLQRAKHPVSETCGTLPVTEIIARIEAGATLKIVSDAAGVSKQRISQVMQRERPGLLTSRPRPERPRHPNHEFNCPTCGKLVSVPYRFRSRRYCSNRCAGVRLRKGRDTAIAAYDMRALGFKWKVVAAKFGYSTEMVCVSKVKYMAMADGRPWPPLPVYRRGKDAPLLAEGTG